MNYVLERDETRIIITVASCQDIESSACSLFLSFSASSLLFLESTTEEVIIVGLL